MDITRESESFSRVSTLAFKNNDEFKFGCNLRLCYHVNVLIPNEITSCDCTNFFCEKCNMCFEYNLNLKLSVLICMFQVKL